MTLSPSIYQALVFELCPGVTKHISSAWRRFNQQSEAARMRFVAYFLPLLISLSVAFSLLAMRSVAAQWQHLFNLTHSDFNGSSIRGSHFGRGLEARDERGNDFKFDDFKGKLSLVYFGFTHCPDVCPNTLVQIQQALNLLAPTEAEAVQFFFVTVDPARDTPQRLREYLSHFDPSFKALIAEPQQLQQIAKSFNVFYHQVPGPAGFYTMEHSAYVFVLDKAAESVLLFSEGTPPDKMAADLKKLLLE